MGLLILFGVFGGSALVFVVLYRLMGVKRKGPVIPMVRIGIAASSGEAHLWANRLRSAGIRCRVQDIYAGIGGGAQFPNAYGPELWVREKDEREARKFLGL